MHNWKYTRALASVLTASLVSMTMTGCGLVVVNDMSATPGGDSPSHGETESFTVDTATPYTAYTPERDNEAVGEAYVEALPDLTFDGAAFFITSPSFSYLYPDELGTTLPTRATRSWRNAMISPSSRRSPMRRRCWMK